MAKTKTSVSDAAKSNGTTTRAKAADSPKAKPAASPKAKQTEAPKAKPAASPKAGQQNGAVKKQQAKRPAAAAKGAAKGGQNKNNTKKQQQQPTPKGPYYFEIPAYALVELVVIVAGFTILVGTIYAPNTIPAFLGPIASIAKQLSASYNAALKIVLYVGIALHAAEGLFAVYLCRQKRINLVPTLKWWVQTTILGYFSLRLLLKHGAAGGKKKK